MSEDALQAAKTLLSEGNLRSAVSRAYYSVYCAATHEIVQHLTTFGHGWQNPPHQDIPQFIQHNLGLPDFVKQRLKRRIRALRQFREDADYRPHTTVDMTIVRDCIRDASAIQNDLWGTKQ